jgi:DNA-binding XRE family transcriptional regulator
MAEERKIERVERRLTPDERARAAEVRDAVMREFPPKAVSPPLPGIPQRVHDARKQRGITRYELGKIANVPDTAIRAIERGEDVPLSQFSAVIAALGLAIELIEQPSST